MLKNDLFAPVIGCVLTSGLAKYTDMLNLMQIINCKDQCTKHLAV